MRYRVMTEWFSTDGAHMNSEDECDERDLVVLINRKRKSVAYLGGTLSQFYVMPSIGNQAMVFETGRAKE